MTHRSVEIDVNFTLNNNELKENMMELKDKLNLLWKFLFLAVFTYAVVSMTCCKKSSSTSCCSKQSVQVTPCGKQLDK